MDIILLLIRINVYTFVIMWLYLINYSTIDKIFKLNSDFKGNIDHTITYMFISVIPGINTINLLICINEDIKLYKESRRKD